MTGSVYVVCKSKTKNKKFMVVKVSRFSHYGEIRISTKMILRFIEIHKCVVEERKMTSIRLQI